MPASLPHPLGSVSGSSDQSADSEPEGHRAEREAPLLLNCCQDGLKVHLRTNYRSDNARRETLEEEQQMNQVDACGVRLCSNNFRMEQPEWNADQRTIHSCSLSAEQHAFSKYTHY